MIENNAALSMNGFKGAGLHARLCREASRRLPGLDVHAAPGLAPAGLLPEGVTGRADYVPNTQPLRPQVNGVLWRQIWVSLCLQHAGAADRPCCG
jgi:hypothetical protein